LKANVLFGKIAEKKKKNYSWQVMKDEKGNKMTDANGEFLRKWDYRDRNLSFSSPITEISAQLEINFFNIFTEGHKNQISPYLFGGAAVFSFNPQAVSNIDEKTYDLQPIGTEGQGREGRPNKYALTGFAIPFGIGFKANIGRFVCVGAEWGLRYTFTNYLDDVGGQYFDFSNERIPASSLEIIENFADPSTQKHSEHSQRYSTRKNDWYSFAGVVVTIRIGNEDRICFVKTNVKLKHKR
jgi:hypothetical protein